MSSEKPVNGERATYHCDEHGEFDATEYHTKVNEVMTTAHCPECGWVIGVIEDEHENHQCEICGEEPSTTLTTDRHPQGVNLLVCEGCFR